MQLKLDNHNGDLTRIRVQGRICLGELTADSEPLQNLVGPGIYARRVLLNLDEAPYIDSMGMGWLIKCNKRFREAGGKLVIHTVQPLAMQALRVLQLERVLTLAENETAAEALAQGDGA